MIEEMFRKTKEKMSKIKIGTINWLTKPESQSQLILQARRLCNITERTTYGEEVIKEERKYKQMKKAFIDRFGQVDNLHTNLLNYLEYSAQSNLYIRNIQGTLRW